MMTRIGWMTSAKVGRLLATHENTYAGRYFEISAVKRLLCRRALHCSLIGTFEYSKLITYRGLKMSFSRAPVKRFNECVGKSHSTVLPSSTEIPNFYGIKVSSLADSVMYVIGNVEKTSYTYLVRCCKISSSTVRSNMLI